MPFDDLNDGNWILYAAKSYEKPNVVMSEFEEDLQRILYIKRLLTKYYASGELKFRLIMNHVIVLYNVFGVESATRLLFYKFDEKDLTVIIPFLIFLNYLPDVVYGINGKNVTTADFQLDQECIKCLKVLR
jgi:hypothetical protein